MGYFVVVGVAPGVVFGDPPETVVQVPGVFGGNDQLIAELEESLVEILVGFDPGLHDEAAVAQVLRYELRRSQKRAPHDRLARAAFAFAVQHLQLTVMHVGPGLQEILGTATKVQLSHTDYHFFRGVPTIDKELKQLKY